MRDKDLRPTMVAKLIRPEYKMNVWNKKVTNTNTVCKSEYRVEMHHVRMMKDLSAKTNRLDQLMIRANRKQVPLCSCHMKHCRKRRRVSLRIIGGEPYDRKLSRTVR
ncbi:putative 91 kDa protein in cob intron [Golovinomyces cichoracearum]|uniref:Putative 91 kDa protein in cob intron n=1 Tax=Golovinomyces cichoracearum TaxID=62708 RepID=A0A420J1R7_9PEZI|nr:putative 91 kDa protein in cob intron [Golovinomyces cichoracearum]RKF80693.1 putative 91 kDa protein in cob intron [Golovinomyces cichoracearum]